MSPLERLLEELNAKALVGSKTGRADYSTMIDLQTLLRWRNLAAEAARAEVVDNHPSAGASECQHEKVYAGHVLTSSPPQRPWICRKCKTRGADSVRGGDSDWSEYHRLLTPADTNGAL